MVILEEPFASPFLLDWLEESGHAVLDNGFARTLAERGRKLHLVESDAAARRIERGERVYTCSENALEWIEECVHAPELIRAIEICKDKARMREVLAPFDPGFFHTRVSAAELSELAFEDMPLPLVMKPVRGFCSVGVSVINTRADWDAAVARARAKTPYPQSVINTQEFVLESYIEGREYAVDMFYDENGCAHMLNVLQHDFASAEDTTDRCYFTNAALIRDKGALFTEWFNAINEVIQVRDFCIHAEIRVHEGRVRAIEFNPLRFAGLGGTDIAEYAFGYRTCQAYLENDIPDFDSVLAGKEDNTYFMSFIMPEPDADATRNADLARLCERFSHVLGLRQFDVEETGAYGFLYLEATADRAQEDHDTLLSMNLNEYLLEP